jgi:hypothetical protein
MQDENEPLLWMASYQADNACQEGDYCGERNAPVGQARRHQRLSFSESYALLQLRKLSNTDNEHTLFESE